MAITTAAVPARTGLSLMARILGASGRLITQASLSSIAFTLTDLTTAAQAATGALTIALVVFDSLQQKDPTWNKDNAYALGPDGLYGYNFKYVIPAADVVNGGDRYQADVKFVPVTGEQFVVTWIIPTIKVYS